MKQDLILSLEGQWLSRIAQTWAAGTRAPALAGPARVLSDFGGAIAGVAAVDVKPEFAGPVIEKRLRSEGLLDAEARILVHRTVASGGGSRVFYSAIPLSAWQAAFTWLKGGPALGLLYTVETAMLDAARRCDIVVFAAGPRLRLLVSRADTLLYLTVTAYSEDSDDMQAAAANLAAQLNSQWPARPAQCTLLWCDLLASQETSALPQDFARRIQAQITCMPADEIVDGARLRRSAAPAVMEVLPVSAALNLPIERAAYFAEQAKTPLAAAIALAGIVLLGSAGYLASTTAQLQARVSEVNAGAAALERQSAGIDLPAGQLLVKYTPTLHLLEGVAGAVDSPDALAMLNTLRRAAGQRVRIMRVRLVTPEGAYRIDGVPAAGASAQALAGFVGAMRAAGYRVDAEDPGSHGQQPDFFSYLVQRTDQGAGAAP